MSYSPKPRTYGASYLPKIGEKSFYFKKYLVFNLTNPTGNVKSFMYIYSLVGGLYVAPSIFFGRPVKFLENTYLQFKNRNCGEFLLQKT